MHKELMILWLALLTILVSCAPQVQNMEHSNLTHYHDQAEFCPAITEEVVQACTAEGGSLQRQGIGQCYTCTIEYADAGQMCTGAADCMGACVNLGDPVPINVPDQVGECADNNIVFGCRQLIENGIASEGMLCID